jgi:hypothetical protein
LKFRLVVEREKDGCEEDVPLGATLAQPGINREVNKSTAAKMPRSEKPFVCPENTYRANPSDSVITKVLSD